jgi:hypothetical protein
MLSTGGGPGKTPSILESSVRQVKDAGIQTSVIENSTNDTKFV